MRFQKDLSANYYVEKMVQAVSRVKTKYVMTSDNDDFLNFEGVSSCINALEHDSEAACAGGPIYGVLQIRNSSIEPRYSLPLKVADAARLHKRSGFDALVQLFKNYRLMWYSVFRAENYRSIWQDIKQLQISNIFLIEMLQAELAFCHGKYLHVRNNHYVCVLNPSTSSAKEASQIEGPHAHKIFFDDEYRSQVLRMSGHVAKLLGVEPSQVLNELKNYYITSVARIESPFYANTWGRLIRIHEIVLRKLRIFLTIESGIRFINLVSKVTGR